MAAAGSPPLHEFRPPPKEAGAGVPVYELRQYQVRCGAMLLALWLACVAWRVPGHSPIRPTPRTLPLLLPPPPPSLQLKPGYDGVPRLLAAFEKGLPHKVAADPSGQLAFFGYTEVGERLWPACARRITSGWCWVCWRCSAGFPHFPHPTTHPPRTRSPQVC